MKWVVIAGVLLFIGFVVYGSIAPVQSQCEVCLEFNGQLVCRMGAGPTEEEAARAASEPWPALLPLRPVKAVAAPTTRRPPMIQVMAVFMCTFSSVSVERDAPGRD